MDLFLGIDIGGGSIRGSLLDSEGKLHAEDKITTNREWNNSEFLNNTTELISKFTSHHQFEAIGIGSPGPLNIEEGKILHSANLINLKDVPIKKTLEEKFKKKVYLNNDANCAALGEYHFGSGKGSQSMVIFTLGTGLGSGWILNGKLFNGYNGNAFEIGHTTVVLGGAICGCGKKGCAESYFSARGFLNRYKDKTGKELESAAEFFDLASKGEKNALEILDFGTECFAEAIRNVVHTVNPDKIVLVGGLTQSYSLFGDKLNSFLKNKTFPELYNHFKLELGQNVAGSFGAASLCF
ncbi:MAG: ROK family protein [Leptospiraceae bacterium]|nr:ROK family protein [Leptospiraceae bacterium]